MPGETVPLTEPNRAEQRIQELSGKVESTAKERDEQAKLAQEATTKTLAAEKDRDFFKGFSDVVAEHPAAREYQADILAKVQAGYSVKDATTVILNDAGKLAPPAAPPPPVVEREMAAGGSAAVGITAPGGKSVADMSRDEKRAALIEAEQRGDLGIQ